MSKTIDAKILVTPRSFGQNNQNLIDTLNSSVKNVIYNPFGRILDQDELISLISDCDGLIAGLDNIDRDVLNATKQLKVISRYGVGVNNVDLKAAEEMGIIVTNTPLANSQSVAELALGLLISLLRNIPSAIDETRFGNWPKISGLSLEEKTIGIIGFGLIGRKFAQLLKGFGSILIANDPFPDREAALELGVELVSKEKLMRDSDIISLHLPLIDATRNSVDWQFLSSMKKGSYLINTSRGEIVDENALFKALNSGHLAGAGLDVLSIEPPIKNNPLFELENVLITPHMGAHTDVATKSMGWTAMHDCLAVLEGASPKFRVV